MDRIKPNSSPRFDRTDAMLAVALVVVVGSYALGYKLDWSQLDQKEDVAAVAEPQAAQASLIAETAGPSSVVPAHPVMAPAPQPIITESPTDAAWDEMTRQLDAMAAQRHSRVAVYLKDLKSGREWSYHPDDLFPAASLIKVPILCAVFFKIHDGGLALHSVLTLRRRNRVGGSGSLKWAPDGSRYTVRQLLDHLIAESDNTAANMLIEAVGMGYIQQTLPRMGLLYTGIYQEGMSIKSGHVAHENYTTAREMSMLFEKIYRGEMIDRPSSELMMEILKDKRPPSRLSKGLPTGWEIAHKTGLERKACHDSAIFFTPHGDYAMTVLTGSNGDYKSAKDFITRLGHVTFVHYGGYPRYYARAYRRHLALR